VPEPIETWDLNLAIPIRARFDRSYLWRLPIANTFMYRPLLAGHRAPHLWAVLAIGLIVAPAMHASRGRDLIATQWQAQIGRDHPLTGRIWDVRTGDFVDEEFLLNRLASVRYVLAGESHHNPDHHRLQLRILEAMSSRGRRVAVGLESFTSADQSALDRYVASRGADLDALVQILDGSKRRLSL
jgi:hypothetical protein